MRIQGFLLTAICGTFLVTTSAFAVVIDNDIPAGTVGQFSVDITTGGESRTGNITGTGTPSGTLFSDAEVIFDYFSYVDPGNNGGGFQLSGSASVLAGNDTATSSGSFVGANGNTIDWTVSSSIPDAGDTMTSTFVFAASTGTLGILRFLQYLDEDILGVSDDVFFTRGSVAGDDLELFTLDDAEALGISHSGALSSATGLVNASFAGWSADTFNSIKPRITGAGNPVSPTGVNNIVSSFVHPVILSTVFGPVDVVSVLAWDFDPDMITATIITTLGGVPTAAAIPPATPLPEPTTLAIFGLGLAGLGLMRRRKRAA